MKESIGYTVTLNIIIVFITIIFTFLSATLIYYKSNKVSNSITEVIEKYEGYNSYAKTEISSKLTTWGYNKIKVDCDRYYDKIGSREKNNCGSSLVNGNEGYCIFLCREFCKDTNDPNDKGEWYYYYKITTNLMVNIPIINNLLNIPIFSNTNRLYDFECQKTSC